MGSTEGCGVLEKSASLLQTEVSDRSFNLEPLNALHLDHIVGSPEQQAKGYLGQVGFCSAFLVGLLAL